MKIEDRNLYGFPCPAVSPEEAMALRQLADSLKECAISYDRCASTQPPERRNAAFAMRSEAMRCRDTATRYLDRANQMGVGT